MLNSWVLIKIDYAKYNYFVSQNFGYILIIPAFGIISTTISAYSNKSVFGYTSSSLIKLILLTQQTIFREVYGEISLFTYFFLNNLQITKALSVRFSKPALNNSKNFFNSFQNYKMINSTTLNLPIRRHFLSLNNSLIYLTNNKPFIHTISPRFTNTRKLSLSNLNTKLFFSVLHDNNNINNGSILHPYYVTGFSDGEGCFFINVRPRPNRNKGYAIELLFKISLSSKDKLLLEKIKDFFGVGRLLDQGSSVSYNVRSLDDLQVVVNHFDKYPLISNKYSDYILFRQVFELMKQGQHLNAEGLNKIVSIKAVSNRGLSSSIKMLFPKVVPATRPSIDSQDIPSPHWVVGFVEGEGSFYVKISNKNTVSFRFLVTQHIRDLELLKNLAKFFNCGYAIPRSNSVNHGDYFATKKEEFSSKILPFFDKFSLQGNKLKDYLDFKKAVELKGNSTSLTPEKLNEIKKLNEGMNKNRILDVDINEETQLDSNSSSIAKPNLSLKSSGFINKRHYSSSAIIRGSKEGIRPPKLGAISLEQPKVNALFDKQHKFSEWLAGVIDGDGQFKTTKKGFSSLQIVMDKKDKYPLYEIKHKFGGNIKQISGSNALKYKLLNPKGLKALVEDVNGLIRNPIRLLQLYRVCENYNINLLEPKSLTYYSGWFSGIIDSDGSIHINEKLGQLIISVTQKNKLLLEPLQVLYGGRIEILKSKEAFQYSIYRKDEILKLIDSYFKFNSLKSYKAATKLNLIKEFYRLKDQRDLCIKGLEKYNQWVLFKNKWDKI